MLLRPLYSRSLVTQRNKCADFFVCGVDDPIVFFSVNNLTAVDVKLGVFFCHLLHLFFYICHVIREVFVKSEPLIFSKDRKCTVYLQ